MAEIVLEQDERGKVVVYTEDLGRGFDEVCPNAAEKQPGKSFWEVMKEDMAAGDAMGFAKYEQVLKAAGFDCRT